MGVAYHMPGWGEFRSLLVIEVCLEGNWKREVGWRGELGGGGAKTVCLLP